MVPLDVAHAGPPFATDDPEPTDYGHFEIYLYSQETSGDAIKTGSAVGLEVNYGALPNVQVSASLPIGFAAPAHARTTFGVSDAELGIKYRFIEEDDDGWRPQVSFYPSVDAALGNSGKTMADSATHEFLPLWAQKSFGSWTTFGGGGYRLNPGRDGRNSWFAGWAVLRKLSDHLELGVELFRDTAEARDERNMTAFNVGAIYDLSEAFHLVGSAGPGIDDRNKGATSSCYFAIEWTT
jgi:hypothetical protein